MSVGRTLLTKVRDGGLLLSESIVSGITEARTCEMECPCTLIVCPELEGGAGTSEGASRDTPGARELYT